MANSGIRKIYSADSIQNNSFLSAQKQQNDTVKNNKQQDINFSSDKEKLLEKVAKLKLETIHIKVYIDRSKANNDFKEAGDRDDDIWKSVAAGAIGVCCGLAILLKGYRTEKEALALTEIIGGFGIAGLSIWGGDILFNYRRKKYVPQAEQYWNNVLQKKEQEISKLEREYYSLGGKKREITKKTEELFFSSF